MRNSRRIASNRIRKDYHSGIKIDFDLAAYQFRSFIFDFQSTAELIRLAQFGEESFNCSLVETRI